MMKFRPFLIILVLTIIYCQAAWGAREPASHGVTIGHGDAAVTLSWIKPHTGPATVAGYRVYQLREATEMGHNIVPEVLVRDVKNDDSLTIRNLRNGEQYVFIVKAYDSDGKNLWQEYRIGYPGSDPAGRPAVPADVYGAAGDGRVALFWRKNTERDLAGYEVFRRCTTDSDSRLLARYPKVVKTTEKKNDGTAAGTPFVFPGIAHDSTVKNGDICIYRVRSVDFEGNRSDFSPPVGLQPTTAAAVTPGNVLLLVNDNMSESLDVARHYAAKRSIPAENIIRLPISRNPNRFDYREQIQKPLQEHLLKQGIAGTITCLVPCYGVPIRGAGRAVDSKLADLFERYIQGRTQGTTNPYYGKTARFDGTYGIYLVSRLDGPTVATAKGLVDKALAAEQSVNIRGTHGFFTDDEYHGPIVAAGKKHGVRVETKLHSFSKTEQLPDDTYWYFSWRHPYRNMRNTPWPTGAIASHLYSDSFMDIRAPKGYQISWVQGLLAEGITGTFGSVIEPYKEGYTRSDIFFPRFWSGEYTFVEAFMMATPTVQWAMSAVGDPLYRIKMHKPM